jgi:hypothetical protein
MRGGPRRCGKSGEDITAISRTMTEFNPLVQELRRWLGRAARDRSFPNMGRWVRTAQLYHELKYSPHIDREFTWKSEVVLGRALVRNSAALRVLGMEKKSVNGAPQYRFVPNDEQKRICIDAARPLDEDSTDQAEF